MTPDINSRARQLLADIGLKESAGDPPEIAAQYERLVDRVAEHLGQVREAALREVSRIVRKTVEADVECLTVSGRNPILRHYHTGGRDASMMAERQILALIPEPPK